MLGIFSTYLILSVADRVSCGIKAKLTGQHRIQNTCDGLNESVKNDLSPFTSKQFFFFFKFYEIRSHWKGRDIRSLFWKKLFQLSTHPDRCDFHPFSYFLPVEVTATLVLVTYTQWGDLVYWVDPKRPVVPLCLSISINDILLLKNIQRSLTNSEIWSKTYWVLSHIQILKHSLEP